jgi:glutaminyl-tRNA synthetase
LGYKPWKITHTSENFEKLYYYAEELVKKGKAYTCFLTKEEGKDLRNKKLPSPYRNTPPEESLRIFREMRMGLYKENEVCLRAKIEPDHPNPTLRDPPIYRIKYASHPHSNLLNFNYY